MKRLGLLMLVWSIAGCVSLGSVTGDQSHTGTTGDSAAAAAPTFSPPDPVQPVGPQLIIPATGGPPVLGISVGGNVYLPVTGGAPVIGIATGP